MTYYKEYLDLVFLQSLEEGFDFEFGEADHLRALVDLGMSDDNERVDVTKREQAQGDFEISRTMLAPERSQSPTFKCLELQCVGDDISVRYHDAFLNVAR